MNPSTRSRILMFGVYCGLFYMAAILGGWALVAGFVPPPAPSSSPAQIAALFQDDTIRIRLGMIIVMFSALIFIPFAGAVSQFLSRIEGGFGVLSGTALLGGAGNMVLTFYPAIWWLVAAYRPDRDPNLLLLFNDMAWLQFIGGVSMYDAIPLAIAVAAFCDSSSEPIFPRWACYFNVAVVFLILPDQMIFFFHAGPFSWNGVFGFWVPVAVFGLFFVVNFWLMRTAILRERGARPFAAAVRA